MSLGITRLLKIAYRALYDFTKQKENKNYLYIIIAGESLPIYSLYRYFIFYFIYYKCRWVYCEKLIPELREIDTQITRDWWRYYERLIPKIEGEHQPQYVVAFGFGRPQAPREGKPKQAFSIARNWYPIVVYCELWLTFFVKDI